MSDAFRNALDQIADALEGKAAPGYVFRMMQLVNNKDNLKIFNVLIDEYPQDTTALPKGRYIVIDPLADQTSGLFQITFGIDIEEPGFCIVGHYGWGEVGAAIKDVMNFLVDGKEPNDGKPSTQAH